MREYYFDHSATSFPKAPGVGAAMAEYIERFGVNINRSAYASATDASLRVLETRDLICELFHFSDPTHVIFTPGQTYGLNYVIKGLLKPGDRVITSSMEHNAVMRPLMQLAEEGVTVDRIPCEADGSMRMDAFEQTLAAGKKPALVIVLQASNVCGTLLPVKEIGERCRKESIPFVLDAAQTAGQLPIDFEQLHLSALSMPGHKALLGPQGIGVLLLEHEFAKKITPIIAGGTGSASDSEYLPPYMPDRLESGTLNLPAIFGLHRALSFLKAYGIETLMKENRALTARFLEGIANCKQIRIAGPADANGQMPVVSLEFLNMDNADAAFRLETEYGICTRCGLHCAPSAHKTLGTFPQGTVRFSFGYGTTAGDIDAAVAAIRTLSAE